jgi:phosphatidylserine/phosphatidylglycerophosphate/cardiolipin synthase-like enzyme
MMLPLLFSSLFSLSTLAYGANALSAVPVAGAYVNEDGGPLVPLLTNAKSRIDIEIYTMTDKTVRTLLHDALARGVKVRIIKDPNPLGVKCDVFGTNGASATASAPAAADDCADQQKFVNDVRAAGGTFAAFDKRVLCPNGGGASGAGCFEHGKIALVDGRALLSTGNFDGTNLCIVAESPRSCDRDYTLIIDEREVVDTLQRIFDADLADSHYDVSSIIPADLAYRLTVSPVSLAPILAFIDSAKHSLEIETQYLKDPDMNAALARAAQRGVKVNITVASACSFGHPSASESKEFTDVYSAFDSAGISSRLFSRASKVNGRPGYVHAKVIVVDGARAWVGSVNGSTESLTQNREFGLIVDDAASVRTVLAQASADHNSDGAETWQDSLNCVKDKGGN